MLPGVECARRRRLHHRRGGGGTSNDSTTRSFCLYTRNLHFPPSLPQRSVLVQNQSFPDEKLGESAREAKRKLDEKFAAITKSEDQFYNPKRKGLLRGLWHQLRS